MTPVGLAWAAGMLVGLGLVLLLLAALPDPPPDLAAALARLDPRRQPPGGREGWTVRAARLLSRHVPGSGVLGVPVADLRLLGRPVDRFLTTRAALAVAGLAAGPVCWLPPAVAGLDVPPPTVPGAVGLALAAAGWTVAGMRIRRAANAARADFRRALSAYLDLVALERAGQGSPIAALEAAASVGHGWVFTRIQRRLALAARAGTNPYSALAELAGQTGVAELQDLADITAVAADGAAVYGSLLMRARSLRHTVLADERAAANAASERLVLPVALLGAGFLVLLFYPALTHILV